MRVWPNNGGTKSQGPRKAFSGDLNTLTATQKALLATRKARAQQHFLGPKTPLGAPKGLVGDPKKQGPQKARRQPQKCFFYNPNSQSPFDPPLPPGGKSFFGTSQLAGGAREPKQSDPKSWGLTNILGTHTTQTARGQKAFWGPKTFGDPKSLFGNPKKTRANMPFGNKKTPFGDPKILLAT